MLRCTRNRTPTNTSPYDTEANAAGGSGYARAFRKQSKGGVNYEVRGIGKKSRVAIADDHRHNLTHAPEGSADNLQEAIILQQLPQSHLPVAKMAPKIWSEREGENEGRSLTQRRQRRL